jgi:choline dehydrogenase-like flavoprotein
MSRSAWIDLAGDSQQRQAVQADVCVIGAGAAGIYLTLQLARQGKSVVLLEAGPATCTDAGAMGFDALFEASHYPGATEGRFFGMGGSTARWGGQLVPHTTHDLHLGAVSTGSWAHIVETVTGNGSDVLQQLGYRKGSDFDEYAGQALGQAGDVLRGSGIHSQAGLMMPFRLKNLVGLLNQVRVAMPPRVFFNALVVSWALDAGEKGVSRITSVVAVSRNHKQIEVNSKKFVIAAGAIESARILLEINESTSQPVVRPTAAVGCYLADHLSMAIAAVSPEGLGQAVDLFGPRFSGSWMRSFRFLEVNPPQNSLRAFAHFIYSNPGKGFALAKGVLGAVQGRRMPSISPAAAVTGLGDVARLAYMRFVNSNLYIPAGAPVHLQLDMEQAAVRENHVRLADQKDVYGRRMTSIRWQVSDRDLAEIAATANRFLAKWPGSKGGLPTLLPKAIGNDGTKPYDAYHPVGTCRMGEDAEAVVDHDLKVWGVQNLWVSSTGVLPSAGTANPTFTMLCLTHALAENLHAVH